MAELLKFSPEDVDLDVATRAHAGTSMSPEVRGQSYVKGYVQDMEALVARFAPFATDENRDQLAADLEAYRVKYLALMNRFLYSHSAVMSTLITGPAKFPTARNRKRSDWADAHRNRWVEFMEKGRNRLLARYDPREIAKAAWVVRSDDPEAAGKLQEKLEKLIRMQGLMKTTNAILRGKDSKEEKEKDLAALGYSPTQTAALFEPDCFGIVGYPPFSLSNNNAEIRRLKGRLVELEQEAARAEVVDEEYLPGVRLEENKEDKRLRLFFEGKPSEEVRKLLKKNGFRWSPTNEAWQRLLNGNARQTVKWMRPQLAGLLGVELVEVTAVDVPDAVPDEDDTPVVWAEDEAEPVVWLDDVPVVEVVDDTAVDVEVAVVADTPAVEAVGDDTAVAMFRNYLSAREAKISAADEATQAMISDGHTTQKSAGRLWWMKSGRAVRCVSDDEQGALGRLERSGEGVSAPPEQRQLSFW